MFESESLRLQKSRTSNEFNIDIFYAQNKFLGQPRQ